MHGSLETWYSSALLQSCKAWSGITLAFLPLGSSWAFLVSRSPATMQTYCSSGFRSCLGIIPRGSCTDAVTAEAGMFPGCFYLIGMWYKRQEAQKRFSFFFSSTTLAGGFGGLIAAGIGKMDGVGGYRNWRWVSSLPHPSYSNTLLTVATSSSSSRGHSRSSWPWSSSSSSRISLKRPSG
jgi:hypothetical protein